MSGPAIPKDTYCYEGDHDNDGGGTGIVRCDGYKYDIDLWEKYNKQEPRGATEKQMTKLARSVISDKIVFLGETNMGDVGANVFTHRNSRGEIDSGTLTAGTSLMVVRSTPCKRFQPDTAGRPQVPLFLHLSWHRCRVPSAFPSRHIIQLAK